MWNMDNVGVNPNLLLHREFIRVPAIREGEENLWIVRHRDETIFGVKTLRART